MVKGRKYLQLLICFSLVLTTLHATETNVFRKAGIPSPDREWLSFDYDLAAKVFKSGKAPLPRLSDPEGKKLLDHITSTNNLSLHQNVSLSIATRLNDVMSLQAATADLLKLYIEEATKGAKVESEITRVSAFILFVSAESLDLAEQYAPLIRKDEKYEIRMEGMAKMNSGATTQFVGAATVLTHSELYNAEDRHVILSAMAATLPKFKRVFPATYIGELKDNRQEAREKIAEPDNRREIDAMLKTLEK